jgi:adenylate cyclase class IV
MQTYEVEIKALLGTPERADELRDALKRIDPDSAMTSQSTQLNHYFEPSTELGSGGGTLQALAENVAEHLDVIERAKLEDMAALAKSFSVRTRQKDDDVILVVKASVGDDSSANGVSRMEFEVKMPLSLHKLDALVLASGFEYQAKWSREREEYLVSGINVCLDKNAGYGYLAEFERVVDDKGQVADAEQDVRAFMEAVGAEELQQDRLERMFAHYNANWPEYYGTDKIFIVD